ncbi:MAG TPA: carbohydrate-binding domain-containing protein [Polyangiaceae bacterium]|nr:carbohydrate-binding domain-containing protein [Polyangiaceae bacterium]
MRFGSSSSLAILGFTLAMTLVSLGCSSSGKSSAEAAAAGSGASVSTGGSNAGGGQGNGSSGSSSSNPNGGTAGNGVTGTAGSSSGASGGGDTSAVDGPSGEAFNPQTGMLNVHYDEYLPKHDIVYNKPNTNPLYGLTVGNGHVGAMVWSNNGLTMQVSNVDASQQTAFSAGLVNLHTTPGMDATFTTFQQRLALYDGLLTTQYDTDRTVTIMGSPNSEVLGIHVEDSRTNVTAVSLDLSLWDLSTLTNSGNVPDLNTWKTVATYADATGAGLSRGQTDANKFGYTLAATVSGAAFTTQAVNGSDVRLTITPSTSYTIWLACATRLNAPNNDSVTQAKLLLTQASAATYADTLAKYEDFWHAFWARSFVQYSNTAGDADYLENFYYLATYVIGAGGYGNYPFHFINGVFRATQDNTKWSNAYWYWNQRDIYNSFLASNHADMLGVFNNMYSRNSAALQAYTNTRYSIDGIWVPETMGWNGNADGTVGSDYTKNIYSSGTEAAENMYAQYAYTGDANYLKNTVYPFMKEVAQFYVGKLSKDSSGKYYMQSSNAHESYWNVENAITDLAAVRSMFPIAIATAGKLGLDADLVSTWQNVLTNLVPYPTDGTNYLPYQPPETAPTQNDENVAAEIIWPYSVTGIGAPDYAMAVSTWKARPAPYNNVWANDAIQAARLGLGDDANQGMKLMLQKYQSYPNGFTNNTNGVFEYWGVHLSAMNESLLQSYNDKIRVFPALPTDTTLVTRFSLLAKGGFLVSSETEGGDIKYVGLKSLYGNAATVENPWGTQALQVRNLADNSIALSSSAAELTFNTVTNGVYVVERVAKPLSSYTYSHLTGTPAQDARYLSDTTFLGISNGMPVDNGKYEAEHATLNMCNASDDSAASNGAEVINLKQGSSLTFSNVLAGKSIDIRYATMNNPGKLGLYVNGTLIQEVTFPTTMSWTGTYATVNVVTPVAKGATIMLQYDAGGAGANIDFIQVNP